MFIEVFYSLKANHDVANAVTAIASVAIALLTFLAMLYSNWIIRKHNRLSLRPYLCTFLNEVHDLHKNPSTLEVELINAGSGVAIIKEYSFYYNGTQVKEEPDKFIATLAKQNNIKANIRAETFEKFGIQSQSKRIIFTCEVESARFKDFKKLVEDFNLIVEYESIYREKFTLDSSKPSANRLAPVRSLRSRLRQVFSRR